MVFPMSELPRLEFVRFFVLIYHPGPERSGNTVVMQYIFSDFQECLSSANTVEGPVENQCIGSGNTVCTILLLLFYRSKE